MSGLLEWLRKWVLRAPRPPMRDVVDKPVVLPEPLLCMNIQPPEERDVDRTLAHLLSLGIKDVRCSWHWWDAPGRWSWLPRFQAAGIDVMPLVYPLDEVNAGVDMADRYRKLCQAFGNFKYVQLHNERDTGGGYAIEAPGLAFQQGAKWGLQLTRAAQLIREFDDKVVIVAGGMGWNKHPAEDWLRGMLSTMQGVSVVALHVYGIGIMGEPLSRYKSVRNAGWLGPVWATEIGTDHAAANAAGWLADAFQKENLEGMLTKDPSRHYWDRLYWFQYTWDPNGYGLVRFNGELRPAGQWLQEWRRTP